MCFVCVRKRDVCFVFVCVFSMCFFEDGESLLCGLVYIGSEICEEETGI